MKLFTFKYDVMGISITIRIVASSLEKAIPSAHARCGSHTKGTHEQRMLIAASSLVNVSVTTISEIVG